MTKDKTLLEDTTASKIRLEPPSADEWISPDHIERNPDNPRLIFRQKELDELKQSIYEVGILQPLIVYEHKDKPGYYVVIDGERRWRCSRELNLQRVPVHIHQVPTPVQNLTMMFNIHKLRVDWELMPTALSLKKLMELLSEKRISELSRITGLNQSMVRKCLQMLSFPDKYQELVLKHKIKDNLLLETYPVLRSLEKHLPEIIEERGKESIIDSIVDKEQHGFIRTVVELRDLSKVIEATTRGAPRVAIKDIVIRVLDDRKFTIEDAYSRVRSLYDVQHLISQFTRLAEEIVTFDPIGVDSDSIVMLEQSLDRLIRQLKRLKEQLSGSN